jgi:hypothetical protein
MGDLKVGSAVLPAQHTTVHMSTSAELNNKRLGWAEMEALIRQICKEEIANVAVSETVESHDITDHSGTTPVTRSVRME